MDDEQSEESDKIVDDLQDDLESMDDEMLEFTNKLSAVGNSPNDLLPEKECSSDFKEPVRSPGKEEDPDTDNEDEIVPMGMSKRKRAIIEDDDDDVDGLANSDTDQQPTLKK